MARPDPTLLDPARHRFSCEIFPRFGDLDTNLHINNAAFAQILEEARTRFHRASRFHETMAGHSVMVAQITINYLAQTYYPEPLTIHVAPLGLGRTSYRLSQLALQQGRVVVHAEAVMVCVTGDGPAPLPQAFVDNQQDWMLKP